jgi:hypothetical protein
MSEKSNAAPASGGIGFFGALFLVLLVLKLTNVINCSWWLVTAPLWGTFTLVVLIFVVALFIMVAAAVIQHFAILADKR